MKKANPDEVKVQVILVERGFSLDGNPAVSAPAALRWIAAAKIDRYQALFELGFQEESAWFSDSLNFLYSIATLFVNKITRQPELELVREAASIPLEEEETMRLISAMPFVIGAEYVTVPWIMTLWSHLNSIFAAEITAYQGTVQEYLTMHNEKVKIAGRVFFHLVENKKAEEYPFAFMATYSVITDTGKTRHISLQYALSEYKEDAGRLLQLLSAVTGASAQSSFISALMETGELFSPIRLTAAEAYTFLNEIPLYEQAGVLCRIPNWWKKKSNRIGITMNIGEKKPSALGVESLIRFSPELSMGGETMTRDELTALLEAEEGLAFVKGKWIEVNHKKLAQLLEVYDEAEKNAEREEISLFEAMRLELDLGQKQSAHPEVAIEIKHGSWFKELQLRLRNPATLEKRQLPQNFRAILRPYQQDGYDWLTYMNLLGFGACLADDMGLGKTVQVIAALKHIYDTKGGKVLLVIPASLLGNWAKELQQFAPGLPFTILHGVDEQTVKEELNEGFLYITTYGMATKLEALQKERWETVILDEAQAIKNPATKQTKAVKALKTSAKIAMTGTPIENRLSDLWSLFDFLNPGLLGTAKEFSAFIKALDSDNQNYAKLRSMIHPFILRRLKTDKTVIADLPDKLEIKEYTMLTKKQTALYKKLVDELIPLMKQSEGIQKKGVILSAIMKFKQICNHPDQYLGQQEFKVTYSGKFERLREICETIYEKRERVLIFTQFKEIVKPIAEYLETIFGQTGLTLHGGTAVNSRQKLVEQFNGEDYVPFMVLSVKAGGVGLNLTAANHVIHFDRWWNPAVENQATDRVFRIGQKKNVMVYKFVTTGTIEEKIDKIIEEKQQLASDIVASAGEKWITELNDAELMDLFRLEGGRS